LISSLEIGGIFKVIDEASPAILKIADSLKVLQDQIDAAKTSLGELGRGSLTSITMQVDKLAEGLGKVEGSSAAIAGNLDKAMGSVAGSITGVGDSIGSLTAKIAALNSELTATSARGARAAETAAASALLGGPVGSGTPLPGWNPNARPAAGGGSGGRRSAPGIGLREGGHLGPFTLGGPMGAAGMAGAAALGWGIWDEFKMEHEAAQAVYGSNDPYAKEHPQEAIESIRNMSMGLATQTGINPLSIGTGVRKMTHLLSGSGGMNYDQMMDLEKEVLSDAAGETLTKGTSIEGNAESFVEMAHQAGIYDKKGMESMLAAIQAGGVMTPAGLPQVTGALSYSLQQLSAKGLIDPQTDIADVIAMQRMGILRTKSGTWVRDFYEHLLPDNKVDKFGNPSQHDQALQRMGLADKNGKLPWHSYNADGTEDFSQEQANIGRILSGYATKKLAQGDRGKEDLNQDLKEAYGQQGSSFAAILADPKYAAQVGNVISVLKNFKGGDETTEWFAKNDPSVEASKTWVDFQKTMMDFAHVTMPALLVSLQSIDASLKILDAGVNALPKLLGHAAATDGKTFIPDGTGGGMWQPQGFDGSTAGLLHKISGGDSGSGIGAAFAIDKAIIEINQGALVNGAGGSDFGGGFMRADYESSGGFFGSGGSRGGGGGLHGGGGYSVQGGSSSGGSLGGLTSADLDRMAADGNFPDSAAGRAAFIRSNAMKMGIDPDYALSVAKSEGLFGVGPLHQNAQGYNVYGDFQLNYARGVGVAARNAGIEPSDWKRSDLFALNWMKVHGMEDWAASGHHGRVPLYNGPSVVTPDAPSVKKSGGYRLQNVYTNGQSSEYPAPGEHVFSDDYSGSDYSHHSHSIHAAATNVSDSDGGGVPVEINVHSHLDGKVVSRSTAKHWVSANRQVHGASSHDRLGNLAPVDSGFQFER
jgi:hypothetical protein